MQRVTAVIALEGYRLDVTFSDGVRGVVAVEDRLFGPMFEPLRSPEMFSQVRVDEFGAVCWPNGADLAPDGLYRLVTSGGNAA
jgi:hypothetical protein